MPRWKENASASRSRGALAASSLSRGDVRIPFPTLSMLRTSGGVVLASEPYDDDPAWQEVPDRHLVEVDDAGVELIPLRGTS